MVFYWFIGLRIGQEMETGRFNFIQQVAVPKQSVLYSRHMGLTTHMADFAGYLMPLWYSAISREHEAVRQAAGLFDCTHMGVLEVAGPAALPFLNLLLTNDVSRMAVGSSQYSYILDAAGNVLDDLFLYRRGTERFMVVVNAANEQKVKAYLEALRRGNAAVDVKNPGRKLPAWPSIVDLRAEGAGAHGRVDLALQGPASREILLSLMDSPAEREKLTALKRGSFIETRIQGLDVLAARTGYTGAEIGFELYVEPAQAGRWWDLLLAKGSAAGLQPCGLGARDSLRIEAGFPLYGHELAGKYDISPWEAGYGWAVKLEKEFFIGKEPMQKRQAEQCMEVVRLELPGQKGVRPVREGDGVLDGAGLCRGWVLSCAKAEEKQVALAYVQKGVLAAGTAAGIYYLARNAGHVQQGRLEKVEMEQKLNADIEGKAVTRFAKF